VNIDQPETQGHQESNLTTYLALLYIVINF